MNIDTILKKYRCIYSGHIIGTSGKHLSGYCNLDPIMPHADVVGDLTKQMIQPYLDKGIETVVVPAVGAIPFAHWGAHHLSRALNTEILGVWADKIQPKGFALERAGFLESVTGKNVLILEDFINQMFTANKIIELVKNSGGKVLGVSAIAVNKGVTKESLAVPQLHYLTKVEYEAWSAEDCLINGLCAKKVPIADDLGHGAEFKAENPNYLGGYIHLQN